MNTSFRMTFCRFCENRKYNHHEKWQEIMSVQGRGDVVCRIAKTENKILLFVNNEKDYIDQMGVLSAKYNA